MSVELAAPMAVRAFAGDALTSEDDATPDMTGVGALTTSQAGEQCLNGFKFDMRVLEQTPTNMHACSHFSLLTKCFVNISAAMTSEIHS